MVILRMTSMATWAVLPTMCAWSSRYAGNSIDDRQQPVQDSLADHDRLWTVPDCKQATE